MVSCPRNGKIEILKCLFRHENLNAKTLGGNEVAQLVGHQRTGPGIRGGPPGGQPAPGLSPYAMRILTALMQLSSAIEA